MIDHDDADQPAARALRDDYEQGATELWLLDLGIYEAITVLVRRKRLEAADARAMVDALFDLELGMVALDRDLAGETARVAAETGLSGYDAAFLAAARSLGLPLVTGDRALATAGARDAVHLCPSRAKNAPT